MLREECEGCVSFGKQLSLLIQVDGFNVKCMYMNMAAVLLRQLP